MTTQVLTRGQAERNLSQKIQALYRNQLGHQPGKIICQVLDERLTIIIEDSVTQPEQLLAAEGQIELAKRVRVDLDQAIRPQLKQLIEETLEVDVLDLLSDATLATGRTGIIAVLMDAPAFRQPNGNHKVLRQGDRQSHPHEITSC